MGGLLDDDAAAEMKPDRRVRMASSCGVFVMVVGLVLCFVFCGSTLDHGDSGHRTHRQRADTGHLSGARSWKSFFAFCIALLSLIACSQ